MTGGNQMAWWSGPLVVLALLVAGSYLVAALDSAWHGLLSGTGSRGALLTPLRRGAVLAIQQPVSTERPDRPLALAAAAGYAALAAAGLAVVPLAQSFAVADVEVGIVVWGTVEAMAIVALFMRGWAPNSIQSLLGAYRLAAVGLSYLLLSMFVLIAAALPAESLGVGAIVASQEGLWNVVRQPLGLPLFAVVALGTTWWGPMALAGGNDISGGVESESSGPDLAIWQVAHAMMLVSFSAMGAAVFLGGWQGPWMPGWLWMALKSLVLLALLVGCRQVLARACAERFMAICWTVLLPLGFLDLAIAGIEALP